MGVERGTEWSRRKMHKHHTLFQNLGDQHLYKILAQEPDPLAPKRVDAGHHYGPESEMVTGKAPVTVKDVRTKNAFTTLNIAYTFQALTPAVTDSIKRRKAPLVVFLHGVPTNRRQYYPIQRLVSRFANTLSFDMRGMGESDMLTAEELMKLDYNDRFLFDWYADATYILQLISHVYKTHMGIGGFPVYDPVIDRSPEIPHFVFASDDWGAGIAVAFNSYLAALRDMSRGRVENTKHALDLAAMGVLLKDFVPEKNLAKVQGDASYSYAYDHVLEGNYLGNPIALDGYPVREIIAIGRTFTEMKKGTVTEVPGNFDQTLVQILKQMVVKRSNLNQYSLADLMFPYADVDYNEPGNDASTYELHKTAILNLSARASVLSPDLLLPVHTSLHSSDEKDETVRKRVKEGIYYAGITNRVRVVWGDKDQMMPPAQVHRLKYVFRNAETYDYKYIGNADHFAVMDNPELWAEYLVDFLGQIHGGGLVQLFWGFRTDVVLKGDEMRVREAVMEIAKPRTLRNPRVWEEGSASSQKKMPELEDVEKKAKSHKKQASWALARKLQKNKTLSSTAARSNKAASTKVAERIAKAKKSASAAATARGKVAKGEKVNTVKTGRLIPIDESDEEEEEVPAQAAKIQFYSDDEEVSDLTKNESLFEAPDDMMF